MIYVRFHHCFLLPSFLSLSLRLVLFGVKEKNERGKDELQKTEIKRID